MTTENKETSQTAKSPSNIKTERIRAGSNAMISLIGALVILVAVNYLAMRHYKRSDWTASKLYTLSDKSVKVLESLSKDTMLFALWSGGDPSGRFEEVKEILNRYAAVSPRLKVEMIDPDLKPERVKMIISQYGARLQQDEFGRTGVEAGVFVVSGDNVKFVSSSDFEDMGDMMYQMGGEEPEEGVSGFRAEQSLTSAILHVTSDSQTKVCFTQGHDEWGYESGTEGPDLSQIKQTLVQDGMKTEAFTTLGASRLPKGCDVILVVGPQKPFMPEEAALLESYVAQGGKLLLFVDPIIDGAAFKDTGLESLTAKFGIKLNRDVVFEVNEARLLDDNPWRFFADGFSANEAVKHLSLPDSVGADIKAQVGVFPVAFSIARSMSAVEGAPQIIETLASTSKDSWGETDAASLSTTDAPPSKDQYDTQGPVSIAMISDLPTTTPEKKGGELIVVGDSDVLAFLNSPYSNRDFFSGLIGKLTKRPELISIAPKNPEHVQLNLSQADVSTVNKLIWGEVVFFALLGIAVWLKRRS